MPCYSKNIPKLPVMMMSRKLFSFHYFFRSSVWTAAIFPNNSSLSFYIFIATFESHSLFFLLLNCLLMAYVLLLSSGLPNPAEEGSEKRCWTEQNLKVENCTEANTANPARSALFFCPSDWKFSLFSPGSASSNQKTIKESWEILNEIIYFSEKMNNNS